MIDQTKAKNQLYATLKDLGLQEELKKHLRIQIVQKLQQKQLIHGNKNPQDSLFSRIMASLLAQQLTLQDCTYSLSLFLAESGYEDKVLSRHQITQIMNLQSSHLDDQSSLLRNLISRALPFTGQSLKHVELQTTAIEIGHQIDQRLSLIDHEYRIAIAARSKQSSEHHWNKKYELMEQDLKANMAKDISRFKQFELHKMKVKLGEDWRKKFQAYAQHLEDEYRRKMDQVRKRQKNINDEMIAKQKLLEQKIANAEKIIRQKVSLLDLKSMAVETQIKNMQQARKNEEQAHRGRTREVQEKSRLQQQLVVGLQKKIDYQVGVAKLAFQQQFQQKQLQSQRRRKFVEQEYGKLMSIKQSSQIIRRENDRLFIENESLRKDVADLQKELRMAISQMGNKGERIELLKEETIVLRQENNNLVKTHQTQVHKAKAYQQEIVQLRKDLDELRTQVKQEESEQDIQLVPRQDDLSLKLENLRRERKKEIEKFKLEL